MIYFEAKPGDSIYSPRLVANAKGTAPTSTPRHRTWVPEIPIDSFRVLVAAFGSERDVVESLGPLANLAAGLGACVGVMQTQYPDLVPDPWRRDAIRPLLRAACIEHHDVAEKYLEDILTASFRVGFKSLECLSPLAFIHTVGDLVGASEKKGFDGFGPM